MTSKQPIPNFPKFKKLSINDRHEYTRLLQNFPPYSDYNFMSLWSYNVHGDALISLLNRNIVIRFRDYINNQPFYSFFGNYHTEETASELLSHAVSNGLEPCLKLIPEFNLKNQFPKLKSKFKIQPDRDNYDYVFNLKKLSQLSGRNYDNKRNKVNRFLRDNPGIKAEVIDLHNRSYHQHLLYVFSHWGNGKNPNEINHEYTALKRLLESADNFDLYCVGIFIDKKLRAFSIAEVLDRNFAIAHFTKADPKYVGIFEFLYKSLAGELVRQKCLYFNREQDLGLEGLRHAKLSWRPVKFLKKYTVSFKSN